MEGYVYLFRFADTDYYKIGRSCNADLRLNDIQSASPFEITSVGKWYVQDMKEAEASMHRLLAHKRVRGEWFELTIDDARFVAKVFSGLVIDKPDIVVHVSKPTGSFFSGGRVFS